MENVKVVKGDITKCEVDAIVNAANTSLLGGGGVDGAIHRTAGPQLLEACKKLNGCSTGDAKITGGFNLPARYVIHTVGPVWRGGNNGEEDLLKSAYQRSLEVAEEGSLDKVAFPNISTGIYGFPKEKAAKIAISIVKEFMSKHKYPSEVIFVCFDDDNYLLYQRQLEK
ncbi:O-acetyl-ADP-ribose deacetylase [Limibacter armeniacum]|uniref:O-acetyl-ADP-ribose deacetylase n=1 Tax=Limibacter armeniacum TaxID=466084 RepID=UPI002FE5F394